MCSMNDPSDVVAFTWNAISPLAPGNAARAVPATHKAPASAPKHAPTASTRSIASSSPWDQWGRRYLGRAAAHKSGRRPPTGNAAGLTQVAHGLEVVDDVGES